jgi:hypothetical protein
MIFILNEKRNKDSVFKNWLNIIPKTFDEHPFLFKEEDLQILNNTIALDQIRWNNIQMLKWIRYLKKRLDFEVIDSELMVLVLDVSTRIFAEGKNNTFTMSPYADLFNTHKNDKINIDWVFDKSGDQKITANRDIKNGEEFFDSYDPLWSNTGFLLNWGMTLDEQSTKFESWPKLNIMFHKIKCYITLSFPANMTITERDEFNHCLKTQKKKERITLLKLIYDELVRRDKAFITTINVLINI